MGQHGANLVRTWGQLETNLGQIGPTWGQLGPIWRELRPARTKMNQRRSTWSQLETNMDLKIMQKPLFFLGFFNILRKSLEAFGNALGVPLGMPWGAFRDAWESLGDALGGLGGAEGGLGEASGWPFWGFPRGNLLGRPFQGCTTVANMRGPLS